MRLRRVAQVYFPPADFAAFDRDPIAPPRMVRQATGPAKERRIQTVDFSALQKEIRAIGAEESPA